MKSTFYDILMSHAAAYPKMEPCDYVKLAYQCEFGCGHMLTDRELAYQKLLEEWDSVRADVLEPLTVDIGGGYARLNLAAAKTTMTPDLVFSMFVKSVRSDGTQEGFKRKISLICRSAQMGMLPCDADAVASYAESLGDEMPRHSARYKHLYGAGYRIVSSEMAGVAPLCLLLSDAVKKADKLNIALDGRAASGKTTAAGLLADLFDGTVISMDDYFLPAERKTEDRLAEPGGNADVERLKLEIMSERYAETLTHARFDCHSQKLLPSVTEERKPLLFVEGVYSLHPSLRDFYDVKFFLTTSAESQRTRILLRDGEETLTRYEREWLPLEETYFNKALPELCADMILYT
jgi:uridine kinase